MLEDVIKNQEVKDRSISILLYSIDKEDRVHEDNHTHFYEVRNSAINDSSCLDWYTVSENYLKKEAEKIFKATVKEIEEEYQEKELYEYLSTNFQPLIMRRN